MFKLSEVDWSFLFKRINFGEDTPEEEDEEETKTTLPKNFTELVDFDWEEFELTLLDKAVSFALNLVMAIIILIIGFLIVFIISKIFLGIAKKRKWDPTFVAWFDKALRILLKVIVLILVLNRLGLNMSTVTGILVAAGIAFSAALGNIIPNFVCGVLLLVMKPIHVGDWVTICNCNGCVEELGTVNVKLCSWNNTVFFIPNATVFTSIITNLSVRSKRRLDIIMPIAYSEDVDAVRDVVMSTLKSNPYVLQHPRPFVKVDNVDGSRITLSVNPWIKKPEDPFFFITFVWDLKEEILSNMRAAHLRYGCDCLKVACHMGDQEPAREPTERDLREAEKLFEVQHDEVFYREKEKVDNSRSFVKTLLRGKGYQPTYDDYDDDNPNLVKPTDVHTVVDL